MSSIDKVGYLGPDGTFGHIATKQYFADDNSVLLVAYKTHSEICKAVAKKEAKYGIVAIENVIKGVISETMLSVENELEHYGLSICGEIAIPIQFFYMRKPGDGPITKILSHSAVFDQSQEFISAQRLITENRDSTAEAAEEASKSDGIAAIASSSAEDIYGLERILPESVEDQKGNLTRFWVLSKVYADKTENDKTCFLLNLRHSQEGALYKAISPFSDRKINLLLIYPIPIPGKHWEYTFMVEYQGHIDDENMDAAWTELRKSGLYTNTARFLGSYPNSTILT